MGMTSSWSNGREPNGNLPASLGHNRREFISANVDKERVQDNVVFVREDLEQSYEKLFGESKQKFNDKKEKQHRKKEMIQGSCYEYFFGESADNADNIIRGKNDITNFREMVAGVGDMRSCGYAENPENAKIAEQVLSDFINGNEALGIKSIQERYPQLYFFDIVLHRDEATPHVHVDYIPYATGYKRGFEVQPANDKAFEQMGMKVQDFYDEGHALLVQLGRHYGLDMDEPKEGRGRTFNTREIVEYKQKQEQNERKLQEQAEQISANEAVLQNQEQQRLMAIKTTPRPVFLEHRPYPPAPETKYHFYSKQEEREYKQQWSDYKSACRDVDKHNKAVDKQNEKIKLLQEEWDRIESPLQMLRDEAERLEIQRKKQEAVEVQQQQTAEELTREKQSIPQAIEKETKEQLARSEQYAGYRTNQQASMEYQRRLQAIHKRAKERNEQYDNQSVSTEQNRSQRTKPSKEFGDR